MKRYWSEICAALFLAVVISCFGGVIVYASSAEQQITDQMELTDLQSMVDEMLGEKIIFCYRSVSQTVVRGRGAFGGECAGIFGTVSFFMVLKEKK